jgi:DNA-binding FadR family transcriptional regulator
VLHDTVAYQLERAIAVGLLTEGERLPSEFELAAELGVAQGTLRQALEGLRHKGVIETRRGRSGGSFVRSDVGSPQGMVLSHLRALSSEELRDLGDVCGAVVGAAAFLAAERARADDVSRLHTFAGRFREDATTVAGQRRADCRFYIEVGVMSRSMRLTREIIQQQGELAELHWAACHGEDDVRGTEGAHAALLEAIGDGDGPAARDIALRTVEARVERLLPFVGVARPSLVEPESG